jgi:hypothetical protein
MENESTNDCGETEGFDIYKPDPKSPGFSPKKLISKGDQKDKEEVDPGKKSD